MTTTRTVDKHKNSLGLVLARFERSTLPEHANTRTIFLRILEELSLIQCVLPLYDSYIMKPTPGKLLSGRYVWGKKLHRPWSLDLNKGKGKAARIISLLWPRDPEGEDVKGNYPEVDCKNNME